MASIHQDPKSKTWRISFRVGDKQFQRSLDTTDGRDAEAAKGRVELTLRDIKLGRITIPPDADVAQFVLSDGKLHQKLVVAKAYTLGELFDAYFGQQTLGAKESNTLKTEGIHGRHLLRILGKGTALKSLTHADVQRYVNARATTKYKGRHIRPQTIKKEVNTLQMVWNRAEKLLGVSLQPGLFAGLSFPKGEQKVPFQTWQQIEQTIARGRVSEAAKKKLWRNLFLDRDQVEEVLDFARDKATRSEYVYPLLVFAAHTGARVSEIMRSRVEDLKFETGHVVIREKKRSQAGTTFRHVLMSQRFRSVLEAYFKGGHPGGAYTVCRAADEPLMESTVHEAREWFFRSSKWTVLPGFHVFRHSFASNLACLGIDQRIIDELMGHQTEDMRQRYRHLFPVQKENAIRLLFDNGPVSVHPNTLPVAEQVNIQLDNEEAQQS